MTRAANAGELTKLRSDGQWAKWNVLIDKPDVVYTCRTTGGLFFNGYYINFDGPSGTQTNVLKDMTVLIGSTSGGSERGMGRIRRAPDGDDTKLYIGADPSIIPVDDDYITVLNDFAPWAKHAYGINVDFDEEYTDQFTNYEPIPVFNERIAVISAGGTVAWNAASSWVPGSTITGYAWTLTGASSSTGTTTATPTATYNTSGRFRVKLVVTAANGKTATGWGWVYVLGDNLAPDAGCRVEDVRGESEMGWSCKITAYDRPTIKDRARVVIYSEDYYSGTLGSIGPVSGRENIVMVGWIVGETIIRKPGYDYVEFVVGGPGMLLDKIATMPAGLTDSSFPTDNGATLPDWAKVASLDHQKGLHYLINHRSTLPACVDVEVQDYNWPAHKLTADDETLWGQLATFAKHGVLQCTPDRYGHLYIQRDAALYTVADRTANIPVIMSLGDKDWIDELAIIRRQVAEAGMAEAEGTVYSGGVIRPAGGRAPGELPGAHGGVENISEVNWASIDNAYEIAGLMYGRMAAEYERVSVYHPANNHFIDVAPRQFVNVTIDGATVRCWPRRVEMRRGEEGQVSVELELEPENIEYDAVSIDYPDEGSEPVDYPDYPPDIPTEPPTEPEDPPDEPSGADAVVVTSTDVKITADLDQASPAWTSIISGGPTTPVDSDLPETTNDTLYVIETESVWKTGVTGTPSWSEVWTGDDLTGGTIEGLTRVRVSPGQADLLFVLGYGTETASGNIKPFVLRSSNGGSTWSESWIDDEVPEATSYTVTNKTDIINYAGGAGHWDNSNIVFERIGDSEVTYNPIAFAYRVTCTEGDGAGGPLTPTATSILNWGPFSTVRDIIQGSGNWLVDGTGEAGEACLDDYFGVGGWTEMPGINIYTPNDPARVDFPWRAGYTMQPSTFTLEAWIFWNVPNVTEPTALDVSRSSGWVYVGTANKVWKSTDSGFTWTESQATGANDICCDPQLGGVYYYWSAAGNLIMCVNDIATAQLDTESAQETPLRLARDTNSGRLWTLDSSTTLRLRNLGSWSDLDTGLSGARGLHAYTGGKMIYLDGGAILYSDDYGATQADKTGDWSGFSGPINAHLMMVTP